MSPKLRYILGTVTIVTIIGGTIYAIKKAKDAEKAEGEEITVEEAKAMVERDRAKKEVNIDSLDRTRRKFVLNGGDLDELEESMDDEFDDINLHDAEEPYRHIAQETSDLEEHEEPDEDYNFYEGVDFKQPLAETMTEEDKELRYDPNSIDARNQYMKMELAEWVPLEDTYQTMLKLFDFPFEPQNDGDADLFTKLIDYRVQFFGFNSRWVKKVSFADVILHFARSAVFNQGEDMRYWVDYFFDFNEFGEEMTSREMDDLLSALNNHVYFNERKQTFGLFGLTQHYMNQAIKIANRNVDHSVTYEIEFNEFLKSCL